MSICEKLSAQAYIGYLLGYDSSNIFKIWYPSLNRVIRSRDVMFDETKFYKENDKSFSFTEKEAKLLETPEVEISYEEQSSSVTAYLEQLNSNSLYDDVVSTFTPCQRNNVQSETYQQLATLNATPEP